MNPRRPYGLVVAWAWLLAAGFAHGEDAKATPYAPATRPRASFHARGVALELTGAEHLARVRDRAGDGEPRTQPDSLSNQELGKRLSRSLDDLLGYDERTLRLRVRVLAASQEEEPVQTRVRVAVHADDAEGRELAVTERSSTLVGHLGGMSARTEDHLAAALDDAFERAVRDEAFIEAINAGLGSASGAPARRVPSREYTWTIDSHEESGMVHVVGAALDVGESVGVGARYLHDHVAVAGGMLWGGYGADARVVTVDGDRIDAVAGLALLRGGMWTEQGIGVELGVGAGGGERVTAVGLAGIFFTFYYMDLGFTYQLPLGAERPDWMAGPQFGLRINVPVAVHDRSLRCRSPEPCEHRSIILQR